MIWNMPCLLYTSSGQQADAHDHRIISVGYGAHGHKAQAGPGKYLLNNYLSAEKHGDFHPDYRHDGNQGVAQRMLVNHLKASNPFRLRRTQIILL